MIEHNRSFALKGHGRLGEGGHNGAFNNTTGPKGGGSTESPEDVLRFGTVDQVEIGVRSSN